MIKFNLYLAKYDWLIRMYVAVTQYYTEEIIDSLKMIGCSRREMKKAESALVRNTLNEGLCYSNVLERVSVIVIRKTSSPDELMDSLVHEITHVTMHMVEEYNIDPQSEEPCYIAGDLAKAVFPHVSHLLCKHCRKSFMESFYSK